MSPNIQISIGCVIIAACAVIGFMGGIMVKSGYDRKNEPLIVQENQSPPALQAERLSEENLQGETKIAKVKTNRILEDAKNWLEERIKQNYSESERIISEFNRRNTLHGGSHVSVHITRVYEFIKSLRIYIKEVDRNIEDLLLGIGEEKLEKASLFQDEHNEYQKIIQSFETTIERIKKHNYELCLRFTDKPTLDNILKNNSYRK